MEKFLKVVRKPEFQSPTDLLSHHIGFLAKFPVIDREGSHKKCFSSLQGAVY